MAHGFLSTALGIAACALAGSGATADHFNFAAVANGTLATGDSPIVIVDPGNPALTASIGPAQSPGAFIKMPPIQDFPQASGGHLQETSVPPVGLRVTFNRTVFCVPGMIMGILPDPEMRYFGVWSTSFESEAAAGDEFEMTVQSGLLMLGDFVMPDHLIDTIELHAYSEPRAGGQRTELPLSLGDFHALALSCRADMDGNSGIDVFDLLVYLDQWFIASEWADRTDDSTTDVFDLLAYLDLWFGGGC